MYFHTYSRTSVLLPGGHVPLPGLEGIAILVVFVLHFVDAIGKAYAPMIASHKNHSMRKVEPICTPILGLEFGTYSHGRCLNVGRSIANKIHRPRLRSQGNAMGWEDTYTL